MTARYTDSETFEREVQHSEGTTLVDFYANWCGPCRGMSPVVDTVANELQGRANVVKVNVDESPGLASLYDVQSIPTFIVLRDGKVTQRLVGIQSKHALATAVAN